MSIWDIIAWLAFIWVMVYFILKAVHVFESPEIADIITILSAGFFVGFEFSTIKKDVSELKKDMVFVKKDLANLNRKVFPKNFT